MESFFLRAVSHFFGNLDPNGWTVIFSNIVFWSFVTIASYRAKMLDKLNLDRYHVFVKTQEELVKAVNKRIDDTRADLSDQIKQNEREIGDIKTNQTKLTDKMQEITDSVKDSLREYLDKVSKVMTRAEELLVFNKEVRDMKTTQTRLKIRANSQGTWLRVTHRIKKWIKKNITPDVIKELKVVELHGKIMEAGFDLYMQDLQDSRPEYFKLDPSGNESEERRLVSDIDNIILDRMQLKFFKIIDKLKTEGHYSEECEQLTETIIHENMNYWIATFDKRYLH